MEMRVQDKEIEIPTTLGYTNLPNRDSSSSSSKLSSAKLASTLGERSTHQPSQNHTLIFNDPPQTSHHNHHHHHYPPPLAPTHIPQAQRPTTDPDLSSSPIATTTNTPIASGSNPTTTTTTQQTTIATTTLNPLIRYRECLRNHAASMGSHVVDGCGEFMPSGEEGTPESLRCAACECHRNFHRKEVEGEQTQHVPNYHNYYPNKHNGHIQFPQHHRRFSHVVTTTPTAGLIPPVMVAFGGGGAAESSSEDLNMFQSNTGAQLSVQPPLSKKRFRTKFSQQQKDRMMEFAEKLGWKIQKHDEQEVQQFCSQVGVQRQVFKVWMHNNKQAMKKHQM